MSSGQLSRMLQPAVLLRLAVLLASLAHVWSRQLGQRRALDPVPVPTLLPRDTSRQIQEIQACWKRWNINSTTVRDRLPAIYVHAHGLQAASWRNPLLKCSIDQLLKNLAPSTPIDLYVFAREPASLNELLAGAGEEVQSRLCLVSIPDEQWAYEEPRPIPYKLAINQQRLSYPSYYIMGQWRLLVPYNIMAALGYEYVLQVDDDLYVVEPYKVNLLEEMRRNNYLFGTHRYLMDAQNVLHGLPELAKFFLASNEMQPNGSVWQHVTPSNWDGLYSSTSEEKGHGGYDRGILNGNFMLMSTSLWMEDRVQDWVSLCLGSGGMERHRWQEQGVISWVWLLFTEPHQLWKLPDFPYVHSKHRTAVEPVCGHGLGITPRRGKGRALA